MPLSRAIIRAYDATTQLAQVELVEGPRALQLAVPFVATFDTRYRVAGEHVLMENEPALGPVIVAPWRQIRQGNLQDYLYDATARSFTSTSYADYPGLIFNADIVLVEPSYLWLFALLNFTCSALRDLAGFWRWYCNDAQVDPLAAFGCANAAMQQTVTLACRSPLLAAGTYSAAVQCLVSNSGDTIAARYSGAGYIAIPGE